MSLFFYFSLNKHILSKGGAIYWVQNWKGWWRWVTGVCHSPSDEEAEKRECCDLLAFSPFSFIQPGSFSPWHSMVSVRVRTGLLKRIPQILTDVYSLRFLKLVKLIRSNYNSCWECILKDTQTFIKEGNLVAFDLIKVCYVKFYMEINLICFRRIPCCQSLKPETAVIISQPLLGQILPELSCFRSTLYKWQKQMTLKHLANDKPENKIRT